MKKLDKNKLKINVKLHTYHQIAVKRKNTNNIQLAKYNIKPKQYFHNPIKSFMKTYQNEHFLYIKEHDELFDNHVLDLHGYCQEASRALLHIFFKYVTKKHFSAIQIITGPGPILKNTVATLLAQPKFANHIKTLEDIGGAYHIKLK